MSPGIDNRVYHNTFVLYLCYVSCISKSLVALAQYHHYDINDFIFHMLQIDIFNSTLLCVPFQSFLDLLLLFAISATSHKNLSFVSCHVIFVCIQICHKIAVIPIVI